MFVRLFGGTNVLFPPPLPILSHSASQLEASILRHTLRYLSTIPSLVVVLFLQVSFAQSELVNDGFVVSKGDWPWWRGPNRDGSADSTQTAPKEWDESKNIAWKSPISGRGYGSVCLSGDRLFYLTSDEESGSQKLVCLNKRTGELQHETTVHPSGGMRKNARSTAASTTPATDGKLVFVTLPNSDAIWLTAIRLEGGVEWQVRVSDYIEHQGYGASPALYQDLVIVSSDNKAGGVIAAYSRSKGELVWKRDRPKLPNYPSPILLRASGRDQVVVTGCDRITSLDPKTGETLWETEGATTECVTSTVTDGKRVFTSGGYPKNHMSAWSADGSKAKVWENENRLYVPSPLHRDGTLYGVLDAGIAMAWDSETGKELWKQRLGGTFSASPVLVGDVIYATNESGETFLFQANPAKYVGLGRSKLGREVFATPVFCDGAIYYRCTESGEGERREMLYCIRP